MDEALPLLWCQRICKWATRTLMRAPLEQRARRNAVSAGPFQGLTLYREYNNLCQPGFDFTMIRAYLTPKGLSGLMGHCPALLWGSRWPWHLTGGSSHPRCPFEAAPHATAAVCCWHSVGPLENGQRLLSLGPGGRPAIVWWLMAPGLQKGVPIGPMCSRRLREKGSLGPARVFTLWGTSCGKLLWGCAKSWSPRWGRGFGLLSGAASSPSRRKRLSHGRRSAFPPPPSGQERSAVWNSLWQGAFIHLHVKKGGVIQIS